MNIFRQDSKMVKRNFTDRLDKKFFYPPKFLMTFFNHRAFFQNLLLCVFSISLLCFWFFIFQNILLLIIGGKGVPHLNYWGSVCPGCPQSLRLCMPTDSHYSPDRL